MTSRASAISTDRRCPRGRGFSLVEMLVAIGILVLLVSITMVVISKAQASAKAARLRADLQAIGMALDQYANDFKGAYPMDFDPRTGQVNYGAASRHILAKALIGPGPATDSSDAYIADGAEGLGFRTVLGGKVWPPYLAADKFKVGTVNLSYEILDAFGTPIAYLPKRNERNVLVGQSSSGSPVRHEVHDILGLFDGEGSKPGGFGYEIDAARAGIFAATISAALGDDSRNNVIDGSETLRHRGPYILISAGVDRCFVNPNPSLETQRPFSADNVFNFDR